MYFAIHKFFTFCCPWYDVLYIVPVVDIPYICKSKCGSYLFKFCFMMWKHLIWYRLIAWHLVLCWVSLTDCSYLKHICSLLLILTTHMFLNCITEFISGEFTFNVCVLVCGYCLTNLCNFKFCYSFYISD